MAKLKDILQQQRKMNFVGRQKELRFFEALLKEEEPSFHLLYIYGPGGQGKTTLLKQYADLCKESSVPFLQMDCRYIESHPDSFKQLFGAVSPFSDNADAITAIDNHKGNVVLMIDTFEKLKPLDDWLRMEFLPELPGNVITVISGRSQLSTNWKTDPGWQSILKTFSLQELTHDESKLLLSRRNIPDEQIQRIVSYTHGNPLALSIVADMFD
ncbi:MAG TPA: ATP-binding protein, partial [Chitinophagaceae bacterium]|nr:ATP-binding protein [Chitinophagaceae bacterium]